LLDPAPGRSKICPTDSTTPLVSITQFIRGGPYDPMFSIAHIKRQLVHNIGSPYLMALVSYTAFLFAWMFPGRIYTSFVQEPNILCLDPLTFVYFTACLIAFLAGLRSIHYFHRKQLADGEPKISARNSLVYLLTPLAIATVFCAMYIREVATHIDFVALLASHQAQMIKVAQLSGQVDTGKYSYSLPLLMGTVWWAAYRSWQVKLERSDKWVFRAFFMCAIAVGIAAFFSTADRGNQLDFIAGVIVVSLYRRSLSKGMRLGTLLVGSAMSVAAIMAVFLVLAFLRGAGTVRFIIESSMGYSIASYNRLAALLSGQMTYVYHGTGVYLVPYLLDRHKLNSILPIAQYMGWPTFGDLWRSEFRSVAAAGLNSSYIWSGTFGYLYSDLGWGALVYLYIVGIVIGYAWVRFKVGGSIALVVYPYMTFWILFWFSSANLFDYALVGLAEVAVGLLLWDKLCLHEDKYVRRAKEQRIQGGNRPSGYLWQSPT
jgi:hypothetical protein